VLQVRAASGWFPAPLSRGPTNAEPIIGRATSHPPCVFARPSHCSCSCYLFCGNEFHSCLSGAVADGSDAGAAAAWGSDCDEPLACSVVQAQTRRFLLRPTKGRMATAGGSYDKESEYASLSPSLSFGSLVPGVSDVSFAFSF
jgi:hypothetical protein